MNSRESTCFPWGDRAGCAGRRLALKIGFRSSFFPTILNTLGEGSFCPWASVTSSVKLGFLGSFQLCVHTKDCQHYREEQRRENALWHEEPQCCSIWPRTGIFLHRILTNSVTVFTIISQKLLMWKQRAEVVSKCKSWGPLSLNHFDYLHPGPIIDLVIIWKSYRSEIFIARNLQQPDTCVPEESQD